MVEIINGAIQGIAKFIFIPCVITDFCQKIHTTRMNDYFKILNELDTAVDAVFALGRAVDAQSKSLQFINAFWFG